MDLNSKDAVFGCMGGQEEWAEWASYRVSAENRAHPDIHDARMRERSRSQGKSQRGGDTCPLPASRQTRPRPKSEQWCRNTRRMTTKPSGDQLPDSLSLHSPPSSTASSSFPRGESRADASSSPPSMADVPRSVKHRMAIFPRFPPLVRHRHPDGDHVRDWLLRTRTAHALSLA